MEHQKEQKLLDDCLYYPISAPSSFEKSHDSIPNIAETNHSHSVNFSSKLPEEGIEFSDIIQLKVLETETQNIDILNKIKNLGESIKKDSKENRRQQSLTSSECTNLSRISEITELSSSQFDIDLKSKSCCVCLLL